MFFDHFLMVAFDLMYGPCFYFITDHPEDLVSPSGLFTFKHLDVLLQKACIAMILFRTPPVPLLSPHF